MNDKVAELLAKFKKEYGDQFIVGADKILEEKREIFSVTPLLDIGLHGGIAEGSLSVFTGPPKSGKTTTAIHTAIKTGREIYYDDIENRLKEMNLICHAGFDPNKFHVIRSTEDKILTAEDHLTITDNILNSEKQVVLIMDSFSALVTNAEYTEGIDKQQRADAAKMLSKWTRKVSGAVQVKKHIVMGITHIIANPGGYGAPTQEKSGNAIKYMLDNKLRVKSNDWWLVGNEKIGEKTTWIVETSALGAPGAECESYHRYGSGIDEKYEVFTVAVQLGLIEVKGSWVVFHTGEKVQGLEKAYQMMCGNDALYKDILEKVGESLK